MEIAGTFSLKQALNLRQLLKKTGLNYLLTDGEASLRATEITCLRRRGLFCL